MRRRITKLEAETKRKRAKEARDDKKFDCLRILVVDDDPTALDFYQEVLCSTKNLQGAESTTGDLEAKLFGNRSPKVSIPSFDVTLCHQGDEAVETVRAAIRENKPFAMIFLDVRLPPGPNGVWTAKRIRALDPYVQIVMVTGYSDVNPLELACQVPPVDKLFYVQKPLDPQEVWQFASALGAKWHVERRLRKIHAELEDRIQKRTAELTKANEQLKCEVAERKRAEEALQASLKEKEILLQEIHHRVKNNMQLVYSLIKLQSGYMRDKMGIEMLKEIQNRVRSMSLIHEKLYQSKDLASVDFNEYVSDLVNVLYRAYGVDRSKIKLEVNVKDVSLRIDFAIPCGLIINELVSNSLKHAFPEGREGKIKVALHPIDKNQIELVVSDNGVGIPKDLDFRETESLGLRLVTILAEDQLHSKIKLDGTKGTKFKIKFKVTK